MRKCQMLFLTLMLLLITACAAPTPQVIEKEIPVEKIFKQTVVVEKEVIVEKVVKETVLVAQTVIVKETVERIITATPASPTATPVPRVLPTATLAPTAIPEDAIVSVCAADCDFTTIQTAVDAATDASIAGIKVTDAVHTEAGIIVDEDIAIWGQGASSTVIQAHDMTNKATDRVFFIAENAVVTIKDVTIQHGYPITSPYSGGAIMNLGTLTLVNSVIQENRAADGGGIRNIGTLTVINSTIRDNLADREGEPYIECGSGGGIKNANGAILTLINSTVSDNVANGKGGGIDVACEGIATLINSTLSGNRSASMGGGARVNGTLKLTHCTINSNKAREGGSGIHVNNLGTLEYSNTIIANNHGGDDCFAYSEGGIQGKATMNVNVNNLVEDGNCDAAYSGDPLLGPLADNGGDTRTHALLPDSPAIDAIAAADCVLTTDQRGAARPVPVINPDTPCDIGAVELQMQ